VTWLKAVGVCALVGAFPLAAYAGGDTALDPGYSAPQSNQWQFSFTPYAWVTGVNGDVTARGHTVDIDASFIDIVEKSDSLLALMGYVEARKGAFSFFTDVVWMDLGFPGHAKNDFNRQGAGRPSKFPNVDVTVDANLSIKSNAQLDYESTIIQSGAGFEVANWSNASSHTAFDMLGGVRYWNQSVDSTVNLTGDLTVDVTATATFDPRDVVKRVLRQRGFKLNRRGANLIKRAIDKRFGPGKNITVDRSVKIELDRAVAVASTGDLEWVDPFIGGRLRHGFGDNKELTLEGDVGGFGVGSDFSWQVVATYGFDVNCFGTPLHTVIGYRALAVDYSEESAYGENVLDVVMHGPLLGVNLRW
jgi:hypothetical protein